MTTRSQETQTIDPNAKAEVIQLAPPPDPAALVARVAELEAELATAGRTMTEFKALVRTEAMRMAEQNNLCTVVENTLQRVGISVVKLKYEVVQQVEAKTTLEVPEDLMTLLTPEQLSAWALNRTLPPGRTQREMHAIKQSAVRNRNVGTPTLREVPPSEVQRGPAREGLRLPPHHLGVFTSHDGRSMHIISTLGIDLDERLSGTLRGLRYSHALCSVTSNQWRRESRQDTGRICRRCAQRAGLVQ